MFEGDGFCMEVKSVCLHVSVEWVAKDGGIQTFSVGAVYSQLVSTPSLRIESQTNTLDFEICALCLSSTMESSKLYMWQNLVEC